MVKTYMKLPLWAKIVVPVGIVLFLSFIISSIKTIIGIGLIIAVVLGIVSLVGQVKKKD